MTFSGYTAYLDGSLKLDRFGQWWHQGRPFLNVKLSEFFHRSIIWDNELQRYLLQIGAQRATFNCEDTAYFVRQLLDQQCPWQIKLNDQSCETFDAGSLKLGAENQIYCLVKDAKHRARFSREAYQALLPHVIDEFTLNIEGMLIRLNRD